LEAGLNNLDRIGCELIAETARAGHEVRLRVNGSSMLPSIWPGDALTVRPLRDAPASEGQVILFTREGRLFAHRVVGRLESASSTQLITRGDAHDHCDPPVAASEILGTVASISRGGREVQMSTSPAQNLISFGIRHSDFIRRAALKIHSIRRRSWTA
jgi:signal peptidase